MKNPLDITSFLIWKLVELGISIFSFLQFNPSSPVKEVLTGESQRESLFYQTSLLIALHVLIKLDQYSSSTSLHITHVYCKLRSIHASTIPRFVSILST
jgi:hypothetical protein